jgi:hypothetical protein
MRPANAGKLGGKCLARAGHKFKPNPRKNAKKACIAGLAVPRHERLNRKDAKNGAKGAKNGKEFESPDAG